MPDFSTDIDIDPSEYVSECSHSEIIELIEILVEDGHLDRFNGKVRPSNNHNGVIDDEWKEGLSKLLFSKHLLSSEDEIVITNIIKKLV
jgi:hypothetical protein